jgi:hypothetical protein
MKDNVNSNVINNNIKSITYLKFLKLAKELRVSDTFPKLDSVEEMILKQCAIAWLEEKPTTVLESMNACTDISAGTAHRRLKILRKKGFITLSVDDADNRIKYIVPTDLCKEYFKQLDNCIKVAVLA